MRVLLLFCLCCLCSLMAVAQMEVPWAKQKLDQITVDTIAQAIITYNDTVERGEGGILITGEEPVNEISERLLGRQAGVQITKKLLRDPIPNNVSIKAHQVQCGKAVATF